jgi:hypothetical protein
MPIDDVQWSDVFFQLRYQYTHEGGWATQIIKLWQGIAWKRGKNIPLNKTHLVIELKWYKGNKIMASIMLICGNNILDDFIRYKTLFLLFFGFSFYYGFIEPPHFIFLSSRFFFEEWVFIEYVEIFYGAGKFIRNMNFWSAFFDYRNLLRFGHRSVFMEGFWGSTRSVTRRFPAMLLSILFLTLIIKALLFRGRFYELILKYP